MFIGQHTSSLDNKNRLAIPAQFRDWLKEGVYVTQGFDRNLLLLTCDAFDEILRRVKGMNMADPTARLLFRMLLGSAAKLDLDKNGVIQLPKELVEFAGIEGDLRVVGQGDYIEVWSPSLWREQLVSLNNVEANAYRFTSLSLSTGSA